SLERGEDILKKKPDEAIPFLPRAIDDPENLNEAPSSKVSPRSRCASAAGAEPARGRVHMKSLMGPRCFEIAGEEHAYGAPNFWGVSATRGYTRVLGALVHAETNLEILRICESDNMGQRGSTSALLRVGRAADAPYFAQRWLEADGMPEGSGIDLTPPHQTPLTDAECAETAKSVDLRMIHSAALALDGDSALARQYLHIAARYLLVFIKVLGKLKERGAPRALFNGAEDTRDHLWLAQDLWTQDAVWSWVDGDPVGVLRLCSDLTCKKREACVGQWEKCLGCRKVLMCLNGTARICQKGHWADHKEACKEEQYHVLGPLQL
ncbi:hypothetical protein B0H17DRAFT_949558, partial [Mycena rosella]